MRRVTIRSFLLCGLLILGGTGRAFAQTWPLQFGSVDFSVMWSSEHAKIANTGCQCFWLQGGSADGVVNLYRGLGVAAEVNGGMASNIAPGVGLSKITFAAGPRYTWNLAKIARRFPLQIFGQGLFGDAYAFNSVFPVASGTETSANSFSMQFGGGANLGLWRGIGVRLIEVQYVRTSFPNNFSNSQNDVRLSAGITWRMRTKKD
jgi:hypothetical protein